MFRLYLVLALIVEVVALTVLTFVIHDAPILLSFLAVPLTLAVFLVIRRRLDGPSRGLRRLSPERITGYRQRVTVEDSPESLSRSIIERTVEIRRTLKETPSDVQVEMCALGYRACANDMITLTNLTNQQLRDAPALQRFKLRQSKKRAMEALSATREAMPPGALRATRQEQQ